MRRQVKIFKIYSNNDLLNEIRYRQKMRFPKLPLLIQLIQVGGVGVTLTIKISKAFVKTSKGFDL